MSNANIYKNLRAWVKTSSQGILIPGSVQFRKQRPVGPNWHELTLDYCCNGTADSILTIFNNSSNEITAVDFSGTHWTGSLTAGGVISFILPRGYNQSITITHDNFGEIEYTNTTVQGDGVIDPATDTDNTGEFVLTTTSSPNSQYLVSIADA